MILEQTISRRPFPGIAIFLATIASRACDNNVLNKVASALRKRNIVVSMEALANRDAAIETLALLLPVVLHQFTRGIRPFSAYLTSMTPLIPRSALFWILPPSRILFDLCQWIGIVVLLIAAPGTYFKFWRRYSRLRLFPSVIGTGILTGLLLHVFLLFIDFHLREIFSSGLALIFPILFDVFKALFASNLRAARLTFRMKIAIAISMKIVSSTGKFFGTSVATLARYIRREKRKLNHLLNGLSLSTLFSCCQSGKATTFSYLMISQALGNIIYHNILFTAWKAEKQANIGSWQRIFAQAA